MRPTIADATWWLDRRALMIYRAIGRFLGIIAADTEEAEEDRKEKPGPRLTRGELPVNESRAFALTPTPRRLTCALN